MILLWVSLLVVFLDRITKMAYFSYNVCFESGGSVWHAAA